MNTDMWSRLEGKFLPEPNSGCWLWDRCYDGKGYGKITYHRRNYQAHRVSYEFHYGPVEDGLQLDHLCRVVQCINPDHLEPVTHAENMRRGLRGVLTTHCPHGHAYSLDNTYISGRGWRQCKACTKRRSVERQARQKAKILL